MHQSPAAFLAGRTQAQCPGNAIGARERAYIRAHRVYIRTPSSPESSGLIIRVRISAWLRFSKLYMADVVVVVFVAVAQVWVTSAIYSRPNGRFFARKIAPRNRGRAPENGGRGNGKSGKEPARKVGETRS